MSTGVIASIAANQAVLITAL